MMSVQALIILVGLCVPKCIGHEPFKPVPSSVPFIVYFNSHQRGICIGALVSRMVVLTAAICTISNDDEFDPSSHFITVMVGTHYRHPRRGVRVPVSKVIVPILPEDRNKRAYVITVSPALLLLSRNVPDFFTEVPLRPISIDWKGEADLRMGDECFVLGWHFFYKDDRIFSSHAEKRFHLQRSLRAQFVKLSNIHDWCNTLTVKVAKVKSSLGIHESLDLRTLICTRDPQLTAQPCHGAYGTPLICHGMIVGIMMSPDGQWINCTGQSNLFHRFNAPHIRTFFECTHKLFKPELRAESAEMKLAMHGELEYYDFVPALYGKMLGNRSVLSDYDNIS